MGNVCVKKSKGPAGHLTFAILGLDNAGKTVTAKGLQGESLDDVAPTIGFSNATFKFEGHEITLFDVGGGKRIRDIWRNYFAEVYGVIYVIDSSEPERMDECRLALSTVLEHDKIRGKPILLLANKQDKHGALDEIDICEQLNLEELVNLNKCPCRVETCSALSGQGKKMDKAIKSGLSWMVDMVNNMFTKLNERVERDTKEQQAREAKERAEKRERARKQREERERQEAAERALNGEIDKPQSEDEGPIDGDPFKPLDINELKKKEAKSKEEKRKQKELAAGRVRRSSDPEVLGRGETPRLSRRHQKHEANSDDELNSHNTVLSKQTVDDTYNPILKKRSVDDTYTKLRSPYGPPLGPSPRLNGRKNLTTREEENTSDTDSGDNKLSYLKGERLGLAPPVPSLTPRLSPRGLGAGEEEAENRLHYGRRPLVPLAPLGPIDTDSLKKKKKRKAKKNQTSPLVSDPGVDEPDLYQPKVSPFAPRGWGTPPGQRSMLKASLTPRLETLREPEDEKSDADDHFANKWGLVDDLPDLSSDHRGHLRPNSDYDSIIT